MKRLGLAAGSFLLGSVTLMAQTDERVLEISPFYGYLWGGTTSHVTQTSPLPTPELRYAVQDHSAYGLRLGLRLPGGLEPAIEWTHVGTRVQNTGDPFFGEVCASARCLELDYALAGVEYNFGRGRVQPFVAVSAGVLRLSPTLTFDASIPSVGQESAVRFTGALGVGAKAFFSRTVGFRVDGRAYATRTAGLIVVGPVCTTFRTNDPGGPIVPVTGDCGTRPWLYNADVTGGLVLAF